LLTPELQAFYNPEGSIPAEALIDMNSGNFERGICAIPYVRQRDGAEVFFPVNIISNLYVSNGMSAGNTQAEARAQALSEILERHVKFKVIAEGLCLPDVPEEVIARYPGIAAGIQGLRDAGFGILVKDASLGGNYPVMCVTMLNPHDQGVFASFGAHPRFEIALERALTELLQGRALEALDGFPPPGFDLDEVASAPNIEIHFVDSSGIVHWNFFGETPISNLPTGTSTIWKTAARPTTTPGCASASTPTATTSTSPISTTSASTPAAFWCPACPRSTRSTIWNGKTTATAPSSARPSSTWPNSMTNSAASCSTPSTN
jgi:YcaO-like protein with predicted kinase domain